MNRRSFLTAACGTLALGLAGQLTPTYQRWGTCASTVERGMVELRAVLKPGQSVIRWRHEPLSFYGRDDDKKYYVEADVRVEWWST